MSSLILTTKVPIPIAYLDTVNYYWLNEYKVDGFRFDLSKGFTQTNNPNNVDAWSAYDASRIAILKKMADEIWAHTPEAYVDTRASCCQFRRKGISRI